MKKIFLFLIVFLWNFAFVSSFNYIDDFNKSIEIQNKLKSWENVTDKEKSVLKRLYNSERELRNYTIFDKFLEIIIFWEYFGFEEYLKSIKKGKNYFEKENDEKWILLFDKRTWYIDPEFQKALNLESMNDFVETEKQKK